MTKIEIFQEIYSQYFFDFQTAVMKALQTMTGLTDAQKLQFMTDFVSARETYKRDALAFYNSFSAFAQGKMLEVLIQMLTDEKTALQVRVDAVQERIDVLSA